MNFNIILKKDSKYIKMVITPLMIKIFLETCTIVVLIQTEHAKFPFPRFKFTPNAPQK